MSIHNRSLSFASHSHLIGREGKVGERDKDKKRKRLRKIEKEKRDRGEKDEDL